jgi:ribose transport system ATP-binding protein
LSGGNQQKVLLASRMAVQPTLLVLQEPTRGVDVGARVEIHRFLGAIADHGCAVLLVSSDVEEAVTVSNRLLIMRAGSIVGELSGSDKTQGRAIALAAGEAA